MLNLKFFASRKNVQITLLSSLIKSWEQISIEQYKHPSIVQQHKQSIKKIIESDFLPKLEGYYDTRISYYYLFDPHFRRNIVYTFSVKLFDTPLFRAVDAHQCNAEEKIAGIIARHLRAMNGRGPGRVIVTIMENRFIVSCIEGLFSPFLQDHCLNNPDDLPTVRKMMTTLIDQTVTSLCQAEFGVLPETFTEIDFECNRVVSLAIIRALDDCEME